MIPELPDDTDTAAFIKEIVATAFEMELEAWIQDSAARPVAGSDQTFVDWFMEQFT